MPAPTSINDFLNAAQPSRGTLPLSVFVTSPGGSTPAAPLIMGGQRKLPVITLPSPAVGLDWYFPRIAISSGSLGAVIYVGLEYLLGTLTLPSSFVAGVAMPTKSVFGASIQTGSALTVAHIGTTLVATTPTLTVTYTNQAGVGSRSAAITLPTSAGAQSLYILDHALQGADSGIRSVQNMSVSAGSSGVIQIYGFLPLARAIGNGSTNTINVETLPSTSNLYPCAGGEVIACYRLGTYAATNALVMLGGVAN